MSSMRVVRGLSWRGRSLKGDALLDVVLEAFESDEDYWQIVEGAIPCSLLNDFVGYEATDTVERSWLRVRDSQMLWSLESCDVPNYLVNLVIFHFIKDAIWTNKDVIKQLTAVWFEVHLWIERNTSWNAT